MPRQSARAVLVDLPVHEGRRLSIFCIRYMPTLRVPVRGSRVITAGSVMNGAGSPGQQCHDREEVEVRLEHELLAGALADRLRQRVGELLQLAEPLDLLDEALRRLHLEHVLDAAAELVERGDAEAHAHPPLGPELVDQQRMRRALDPGEEERRPARLDRAVDDLRDLEARVDLGVHLDELAGPPEHVDPGAEVGSRHRGDCRRRGVPLGAGPAPPAARPLVREAGDIRRLPGREHRYETGRPPRAGVTNEQRKLRGEVTVEGELGTKAPARRPSGSGTRPCRSRSTGRRTRSGSRDAGGRRAPAARRQAAGPGGAGGRRGRCPRRSGMSRRTPRPRRRARRDERGCSRRRTARPGGRRRSIAYTRSTTAWLARAYRCRAAAR